MELVVNRAFSAYNVGDLIADPATIAATLAGQYANYVVVVGATFTLAVADAFTGTPLALSGYALLGTPTALDYSVDDGVTWQTATNFVLTNGAYTATGPTYTTQQTGIIQVRDHANTLALSSAVIFNVIPAPILDVEAMFGAFTTLSEGAQQAFVAGMISSLPTSPTGLANGQVWNNGGTPTAVVSQ